MKLKGFIVTALVVLSLCGVSYGQDGNNTAYFLPNLPQRARLNPAYQPEYKVWIGLPALSGVSVNYMNSSFGLDDLLTKTGKDSLSVDVNKLHKSLRKNNIIGFTNENSILTVGIRAKSWYMTLDVAQKNDFVFRVGKDLFTFLKDGNAPYIGKTMDIGDIGIRATAYDEFALGLSKKLNNKWTVGARAKFLLGIANVDMVDSKISVKTVGGDKLELHSKQDIRVSAPVTFDYAKDGEFVEWDDFDVDIDDFKPSMVLNTKNPGFALDLGAEYQFNEKLKLYASITDLGFIRWGSKNYRFSQDASFDWEGADLSDSGNKNDDKYITVDSAFDKLLDDLKDQFRLKDGEGSYTTMLRSKLYAGATYDVSKMLSVGGLVELTLMDKVLYPSLTVSADARLLRNVSAAVSYSVMPGNYVNVGVGITAKLGPVQLYATTDNVMAANYTSTQSVSGRVGINLLFGHKDKKKKVQEEEPLVEVLPVPVKKPELPKDTVNRDTIVKDTVVVAPPVVVPQKEVMKEHAVYHVVMGSFKSKARAEKWKADLIKMGYKNPQIMPNDEGLFRVSATSYEDREEAWAKVYEIRKNYPKYKDVWVLKMNVD